MSFSHQQHSAGNWKPKVSFLFLFFGMKKRNANIPLFMNMVKEKRSSEISKLSKNNLFRLHVGPPAFASQDMSFPVDTLGSPGAVMS